MKDTLFALRFVDEEHNSENVLVVEKDEKEAFPTLLHLSKKYWEFVQDEDGVITYRRKK